MSDWSEVMRRIQAGEPVEDVLDEHHAAEREAFRDWLADQGARGVESLARYDAAMRDLDNGTMRARAAWHSISPAQRRVLEALEPGRRLVRLPPPRSGYGAPATAPGLDGIKRICRLPTIRNLASRDLLDWDGGATDPEAQAVLSDRGRFVLAHGRHEGSWYRPDGPDAAAVADV